MECRRGERQVAGALPVGGLPAQQHTVLVGGRRQGGVGDVYQHPRRRPSVGAAEHAAALQGGPLRLAVERDDEELALAFALADQRGPAGAEAGQRQRRVGPPRLELQPLPAGLAGQQVTKSHGAVGERERGRGVARGTTRCQNAGGHGGPGNGGRRLPGGLRELEAHPRPQVPVHVRDVHRRRLAAGSTDVEAEGTGDIGLELCGHGPSACLVGAVQVLEARAGGVDQERALRAGRADRGDVALDPLRRVHLELWEAATSHGESRGTLHAGQARWLRRSSTDATRSLHLT
mmetsp:Transcript_113728/g.322049  ORF Transcript_113728/g.322049 Transcript_113728/m.322049 type:complete len:290 (-) Transcript_113728:3-872(-)